MADDTAEDAGASPDSGRARRDPPTIDLEATEVTTSPRPDAAAKGAAEEAAPEPEPTAAESQAEAAAASRPASPSSSASISPSISPWVIAPFSGAVAAALVIAVGWMLGWPAVQAPPPAPQVDAAAFNSLAARMTGVEQKLAKPPADPAIAARLDALDKAVAALRGDIGTIRAQSEKLAGAVAELKSAPQGAAAASVDLSAVNERIAQLERALRTQGAQIAQGAEKIASAKPADDLALRRVVAAALLDVAVRHGDPYPAQLAAAKALSTDPDALKPLDAFAATGAPNPFALNRELLALVPKLSPASEPRSPGDGGILDRLQAGAAKLVRVERTDAVGTDRGAIVARATAFALRNDFADVRRELKTLPADARAPVQAWLDKADARDAALAASRKFADDAMADLAKPAAKPGQ
jgi:hypothetical protein